MGTLARINALGGYDVALTAGEDLYRGEVVKVGGSDDNVIKAAIDDDMPIGTVFDDASSGNSVWITVAGIGYAKPEADVTAVRGDVIYVSTGTAGRVDQDAALPAVAMHNREVGHFIRNGSGDGVATPAVLHFN